MRKLVAYTLMGLDGSVDDPSQYFRPSTDPDDPFEFDEETEAFEVDITRTQDAVLLGRGMYEEWRRFWPTISDHSFADFINPVKKYVVTSRPLDGEWTNTEAVSGPLADLVGRLKAQPGGNIGVHGSIQLVQSLLAEDLLDELRLVVGPVVGLPGRRLFEQTGPSRRLRLVDGRTTPTGSLLLTYRT